MKFKRVFLIVLDSLGVGEAIDAKQFNDEGCNTLGHIKEKYDLFIPNLQKLGLLNTLNLKEKEDVEAYYTIARPKSGGKDSVDGHYEIAGLIPEHPFLIFPNGFPEDLIKEIEIKTGRKVIGNKAASGTVIIEELAKEHIQKGALIIYTSDSSTLQIAAHENIIPVSELYRICEIVRKITLKKEWLVSRIIARPFIGKPGSLVRTKNRRDFVIDPPKETLLDRLNIHDYDVISIGKIWDLFNGKGITKKMVSTNNKEAVDKLLEIMEKKFTGLCFANLNDFDTLYGHRRNVEGYGKAIEDLDVEIPVMLNKLNNDDLLIITADHGNDPTYRGYNHTRENTPVIVYSRVFKDPKILPICESFADISATICENFDLPAMNIGTSFFDKLK